MGDRGEPVSLVCFGSPTPMSARLGPIYTPPEHRGDGYVSALTAAICSYLLENGRSYCTCSPTSLSISRWA
jgi:uncharacterized protein